MISQSDVGEALARDFNIAMLQDPSCPCLTHGPGQNEIVPKLDQLVDVHIEADIVGSAFAQDLLIRRESGPDGRRDRRFSVLRSNGRGWVVARAHWPWGSMSDPPLRVRQLGAPRVQAEGIGQSPWSRILGKVWDVREGSVGIRPAWGMAGMGRRQGNGCWVRSGTIPNRPPVSPNRGVARSCALERKRLTPLGQRALGPGLGDQCW